MFEELRGFKLLNISNTIVSNLALGLTGDSTTLTHLDLSECYELSNEALALLKCPNLYHLDLWHTVRKDEDLASLECRNLTHLDLSGGFRLTDQGIASLKCLASLTLLNLEGCSGLTGESVGCFL